MRRKERKRGIMIMRTRTRARRTKTKTRMLVRHEGRKGARWGIWCRVSNVIVVTELEAYLEAEPVGGE